MASKTLRNALIGGASALLLASLAAPVFDRWFRPRPLV